MVFIVGGIGQGKEAFAERQFSVLKEKEPVDGALDSWEDFLTADYAVNLHAMIRRKMEAGEDEEKLEKETAKELLEACPERVLITDEIGCGIVPTDEFNRRYRELTGRICCCLAKEAQEVWRVTAGIGVRIK